jgi:hypothetical protein
MSIARVFPVLAWLALALPAAAADLKKIDRTIAKEPAYQTRSPKYCLLVLGSEAKTRVWLILDGDALYVDRNANGDLTENAERVLTNGSGNIYAGDITEPGRGAKHTRLAVARQPDGGMLVSMMTDGKYRQRSGSVLFAGRAKEAPIIHFNGPASVRFSSAVADNQRDVAGSAPADLSPKERLLKQLGKGFRLPGAQRRTKTVSLSALMGTRGLGEGTFVTYKARDILGNNERIVVEAAFPNRNVKAEPIRLKGFLEPDN